MRHHEMAHRLIAKRAYQRGNVGIVGGARVDDGHGAAPHDVGAGALERERSGVGSQNPADTGAHHVHPAGNSVQIEIEGDAH